MAIQQSGKEKSISTISTFSSKPSQHQYAGYIKWQFFDKESNLTPYAKGTYLGAKKIINLGAGFQYQDGAQWHLESGGDTVETAMQNYAVDVFIELPIDSARKDAITAFFAHYWFDFGPNFIRNIGAMNPANGNSDPLIVNGGGSAAPILGTGRAYYSQLAYLLPTTIIDEKYGRWQPYGAYMHANYDYLNEIIRGLDYWVSYKDSDTSSPEYAYTLIANEIKKYNDGGDKSTTKIKMPNKKIPSKDAWTVSSAEYVGVDVDKVVADHKSGKISKEDMEEILHGDNYKNVNKYREWLNSHIEPYSAGLISKDELPERVIYKVKEYIDAPKEIMYHVTIATDSVKEKGLKTKDEVLAMGGSEGIGGGEGISLTTSNKYANRLFNSMTELQDMLNGKVNLFNLFKEVDERTGKGKDILQTVKSMYGLKEEKTIDFLKNPRDITIESPFYGPKTYKKDDIIRTFYNGLSFNDDEREWMATMGGIDEKFKDAKIGMFEVTVSDKAKGTWHPAEFEFRVYSSGAIKNIKHIR